MLNFETIFLWHMYGIPRMMQYVWLYHDRNDVDFFKSLIYIMWKTIVSQKSISVYIVHFLSYVTSQICFVILCNFPNHIYIMTKNIKCLFSNKPGFQLSYLVQCKYDAAAGGLGRHFMTEIYSNFLNMFLHFTWHDIWI